MLVVTVGHNKDGGTKQKKIINKNTILRDKYKQNIFS